MRPNTPSEGEKPYYPLTDTYASSILFGPLLFLMLGVVLLMIAFIAMPMRPPLEEIKEK